MTTQTKLNIVNSADEIEDATNWGNAVAPISLPRLHFLVALSYINANRENA